MLFLLSLPLLLSSLGVESTLLILELTLFPVPVSTDELAPAPPAAVDFVNPVIDPIKNTESSSFTGVMSKGDRVSRGGISKSSQKLVISMLGNAGFSLFFRLDIKFILAKSATSIADLLLFVSKFAIEKGRREPRKNRDRRR